MSASVVGLVYKIKFGSMAAKAVAVKLADNSNDDGENIFPAKTTVAELVECAKRTVDRYMDQWLVIGVLLLDEMGGGRRPDEERRGQLRRRGRSSVYCFNMPLLHALAAGETSIDALIRDAQERGQIGADGWADPDAVAAIKGATLAPFGEGEDDETKGATLAPFEDGKGCNPVNERVQGSQGKGARVAPEPSRNHHLTPTQGRAPERSPGEGSAKRAEKAAHGRGGRPAIDDLLDEVGAEPHRERVVEQILAPICRMRHLDAPSPLHALKVLGDWLAKRGPFDDATAAAIVEAAMRDRQRTVRPSDIEDAVKAITARRKHAAQVGAGLPVRAEITVSAGGMGWDAWLDHLTQLGALEAVAAVQQAGQLRATSRWPNTPGAELLWPKTRAAA